jgi:hypothetical protein
MLNFIMRRVNDLDFSRKQMSVQQHLLVFPCLTGPAGMVQVAGAMSANQGTQHDFESTRLPNGHRKW